MNKKRQRLIEIQQRMAQMDVQARQENRDLTDQERTEWEGLVSESNDLKRAIEAEELRSGQLGGINDFLAQNTSRGIPAMEDANAGRGGEHRNEMDEYNQGRHWRSAGYFMRDVFLGRTQNMRAAQNTQDGTLGGFLVPTVYMPNVFSLQPQGAIVRSRATIIPADANYPDAAAEMPMIDHTATDGSAIFGGAKVTWTGEGVASSKTDVQGALLTLNPNEVSAEIDITNKLLRNSPASSGIYMTKLEQALVAAMDLAYLMGSGVKKPLGILNSTAALKVKRNQVNMVGFYDLARMLSNILISGAGLGGYVWVANQTVMKELVTMMDGNGNSIYIAGDATKGISSSLFGLPVIWTSRVPAMGSTGDIGLYDFSFYAIKDGYGPAIATSAHAKFSQKMTVVQGLANTDGRPILKQPIVLEDGDTQASPFVLLDSQAA